MSLDIITLGLAKSYTDQHSGGGGQVQPDWNQNDETAKDYVKNRPFYTDNPVETVLVEESTVPFSISGNFYVAELESTFSATVGETYKVSWDGTVYECTCVNINNHPFIGNPSIIGRGSDTGEPFLIVVANGMGITVFTTDTSASHTFSISRMVAPVVKIEPKYLPMSTDDSYGIIKKSDIVSAYNFPINAEHGQMVDAISAFKTGNASIAWSGRKVIYAYYNSSDDTLTVAFSSDPLKFLTYTNVNGFYNVTLGSPTYGELQGNKVRILNGDTNAYCTLEASGEQSDIAFKIEANHLYLLSHEILNQNELYLNSSTANSTKRFKITIDDSGTLTATEVT